MAISSTITHGITLSATGTYASPLTILSTGYIDNFGPDNAITGPNSLVPTIVNSGRVTAAGSFGAAGIALYGGGSVGNSGTIRGASGTSGTIGGIGGSGIVFAAAGVVGNTGSIAGGRGGASISVGTAGGGGAGGTGISFAAYSTLLNSGVVTGGTGGAGASGGAGGTGGVGVLLSAGGSIRNTGSITGGAGAGTAVAGAGVVLAGYGVIANGGIGNGSASIRGDIGVVVRTNVTATVVNFGTIASLSGSNGTAVLLSGDANILMVEAGSQIIGKASGNSGALKLGGDNGAGTINGIGSQFVGFADVAVDHDAVWSLGGANTIGGHVEIGAGSTLVNAGVLTGTAGVTPVGNQGGREAGAGIYVADASGIFINTGTIIAGNGAVGGTGLRPRDGGGGGTGAVFLTTATVDNNGIIIAGDGGAGTTAPLPGSGGSGGAGLVFSAGGYLHNSGLVIGGHGGARGIGSGVNGAPGHGGAGVIGAGTITNTGTILGGAGAPLGGAQGVGVLLADGVITNGAPGNATSSIQGYVGIVASGTATVTSYGTVIGNSGTAIAFGTGGSILALGHGYSLGGIVTLADNESTLELLGGAGPVLVGFGAHGLESFANVRFGAAHGNREILSVNDTTGTLPTTIIGFTTRYNIIDLTNIGTDGHVTGNDPIAHQVTISGVHGTVTLQLDPNDSTAFTTVSDGAGGTNLSIACYCHGTMILTPDGETPVQELAVGDNLVTVSGDLRPIRWIGRRGYGGRFIAGNRDVLPICFKLDAIMKGVPARDLWVSPEHSLYLDDVLVQAKHLVNGSSVVQSEAVDEVDYFHIELDSHDVIYADGAPAETFVDCDNRLMFANGAEYADSHPNDEQPRWQFCAPRLEWGSPRLAAIRGWMFERARDLDTGELPDPELELVVNGRAIAPVEVSGSLYRFELAAAGSSVSLRSRSHIPAETDPCSFDTRRLGVAVQQIVLASDDLSLTVNHWNSALRLGFHTNEETHRWTDGMAGLPEAMLRAFPGPLTILVRLSEDVPPPRSTRAKLAA